MKAFAQLQAAVQEDVVCDFVVARTVVEIHVPTVIAAPTIVTQDRCLHGVELRELRQQLGRGVL